MSRVTAGIIAAMAAMAAMLAGSAALGGATLSVREMQSAARYCSSGLRALSIGDVKKASAEYAKALKVAPNYPDALLGAGHVAMRQGRFEEALSDYQSAKDVFGLLGESIYDLQVRRYSEAQRELGSLRASLQIYQSQLLMIGKAPGGSEAPAPQLTRTISMIEEAIHTLEAVQLPARTDSKQPPGEIYFYIGNALFRLDRFDEATAAWETCAARSPKFAMVRINLTVSYWKKGRFDDAKSTLARAEELGFPVNPQMKADLDKAAAASAASATPESLKP